MAQHDYNIANATFPNTRTDINNALSAIATNNSGDGEPSTTFANQWWYETDTNKLYIRNEDNDAFIHILTLNQTNDTVSSVEGASVLAGIDDQSSSNDDQITIKDTEVVINEDSDSINFRVESNGNAHQLFVDGANDRIYVGAGLGASIGSNKFQVQNGGATISSFANDSGSNQLHFVKSRNATVGSRTIVNDGDSVGGIFWKADDGDATDYNNNVAGIEGVIDGTPGTNDTPGRLVFYTTNDGERTNTERMRITSTGTVGIGTTSPQTTLHVEATAPIIRISDSNSTSEDDAVSKIQFYDRNNTDLNAEVIAGDGSLSNLILSAHNNRAVIAQTNGNNERFRVHGDGTLSTGGETVTDVNVGGLTLQMNAGDGGFLTGKSSDVAHGMTNIAETDTFFRVAKENDTGGGVEIRGLSESDDAGVTLDGIVANRDSGTNTTGKAPVSINARKQNGTTTQSMDDVDNMLVVRDSGTTRFIVKGDGELHNDQTATVGTFDTYEDAQLVRAYDLTHGKGVINSKFDDFIKYNHEDLAKANLVGREPDGTPNHFVNITGFQRLHNGAIWQQYTKHQNLAKAVYELAKVAVGEDKANEILKENEIKLLN